jgi:hypothetical protein
MTKRSVLLIAGLFLGAIRNAAGAPVLVHLADQTTIGGTLASLKDDKLTITLEPATQPATNPATQPVTQPTSRTIALRDIAQVEFPRPATTITPSSDGQQQSGGLLTAVIGAFFPPSDPSVQPPAGPPPPPAATQPAAIHLSDMHWVLGLKNGDQLHARPTAWGADKNVAVTLSLAGSDQKTQIASAQFSALWCGSDAAVQKAFALKTEAGTDDTAFVEKDGAVISVKGHVNGVHDEALLFQFGDTEKKIALARLVGIIFAHTTPDKAPADSLRESFRLTSGDIVSGSWTKLDTSTVSLLTTWGATLQVPITGLDSINILDQRATYLSDLAPAKVEQVPFFGRVIPFRLDRSLEGGPLHLSDGTYMKGIAVHSKCVLQYDLHGMFMRFQSKVGFEDPQGQLGTAVTRVLGDSKVIYKNTEARGDQPPAVIDVDVTGVQHLTLEVDFGKGQDVDARVIWANARLLRNAGVQ